MKTYLVIAAALCAGVSANLAPAFADVNEAMKDSRYCRNNAWDPLCMGPEMLQQRTQMLEMTRERAIENRSRYCREEGGSDPICDPKWMNDTTGY